MQLEMFRDDVPHPIDLTTIARGVFRYEVAEALRVMRNIGMLHTETERVWCKKELGRLLDNLTSGDIA
jgi:hypothetical protein